MTQLDPAERAKHLRELEEEGVDDFRDGDNADVAGVISAGDRTSDVFRVSCAARFARAFAWTPWRPVTLACTFPVDFPLLCRRPNT